MNNQALALEAEGEHASAERLYRRAIDLAEQIPTLKGPTNVGESEVLAATLQNYAILLHKLKRDAEAAKLEARLKAKPQTVPR